MNSVGDYRDGPGRRNLALDLAAPLPAFPLLLAGLILTSLPVLLRRLGSPYPETAPPPSQRSAA